MPQGPYKHAEAFCLMRYMTKDGREIEYIWNSRDGVTPFMIRSQRGVEMHHVMWQNDLCIPDYIPKVGDRIFVDLTEERSRAYNKSYVDTFWEHPEYPMNERFKTKQDAIDYLVDADLTHGGGNQPDLIRVTQAIREQLVKALKERDPNAVVPKL